MSERMNKCDAVSVANVFGGECLKVAWQSVGSGFRLTA